MSTHTRTRWANTAQETLAICERGQYTAPSGRNVDLFAALASCMARVREFSPAELAALPAPPAGQFPTRISVTPESTLAAARRLVAANPGVSVFALNFASARNPGGGFLGGAVAQEETIARSSALYPTQLQARTYYRANRAQHSCLYTDWMILSPDVPVFRDDEGELLGEPYQLGVITAPAPNAGAVKGHDVEMVPRTLERRAELVFRLAHNSDCRILILGAWGCGVFRNDPAVVARVFHDLLVPREAPYRGCFEEVCFAVFDVRPGQPALAEFRKALER